MDSHIVSEGKDHRIVELASRYNSGYDSSIELLFLDVDASYNKKVVLSRLNNQTPYEAETNRNSVKFEMSFEEMDALQLAWEQYSRDVVAKAGDRAEDRDPFLPD